MKTLTFTFASLILGASMALAADPLATTEVNFEDLKVACQNPAKFHNQIAPSSIQVSCLDVQYKWIAAEDGALSLNTARDIQASVMSDKYSVTPMRSAVASAPQVIACAQYKEISETVNTVRAVSCDELVAFNGTGIEFCSSASTALRGVNKEAIVTSDTGKTASLCANSQTAAQRIQQ